MMAMKKEGKLSHLRHKPLNVVSTTIGSFLSTMIGFKGLAFWLGAPLATSNNDLLLA